MKDMGVVSEQQRWAGKIAADSEVFQKGYYFDFHNYTGRLVTSYFVLLDSNKRSGSNNLILINFNDC